MVYELEAYNTDCRYSQDVKYREYTSNKKKAEKFNKIPKIHFTNSGHGIVFNSREHNGKRKPIVKTLDSYVREHLSH